MRRELLVVRLWSALLAAGWAVASFRPFTESDVHWHLALGRAVLRHGARVVPETASVGPEGRACISQEWLWDVGTFLLHRRFGDVAITALVVVLAALAALALNGLAWRFGDREPRDDRLAAFLLVTAAASPLVLTRVRERPETVAMVLLPALALVGDALGRSTSTRARATLASLAIATQLVFTAVHPTFVLGPIVLAITAAPGLALGPARAPRFALGVVAASAATALTNFPALAALPAHRGGDALRFIIDMSPPDWALFDPTKALHFPLYAALWLVALAGSFVARRVPLRELALAALGLVLVAHARRATGPATILLVPLAMRGASVVLGRLRSRAVARALAATVALAILARGASWIETFEREIGAAGADPGAYPGGAARLLAGARAGTRVLSTFAAGAPLSFWLDGHVKTFVDSRTPLFFDDAAYATARAVWNRPGALARATAHFGFEAAVVERTLVACAELDASPDWAPVLVEPTFTTFVRAGAGVDVRRLRALSACSSDGELLREDACESGAGTALDADLASEARFVEPAFARYLEALRLARCAPTNLDGDAIERLLTPRSEATGFLPQRDALHAWLLARFGRTDRARALLEPYLGNPWGVRDVDLMLPAARALDDPRAVVRLLGHAYDVLGEALPSSAHAALALAYGALDDLDLAAVHGLRAAALGRSDAGPALCRLATAHPKPTTREEARAWISTLRAETAGTAASAALACAAVP